MEFWPITSNSSISKLIRTDIEKINQLKTSGIYTIKFNDIEGKDCAYIGLMKPKILERIKEKERDIQQYPD